MKGTTSRSLRQDQIEDLSKLISHERWGLLHDPACGKTPTVCVYLWYCWNELGKKGIWVMPKTLLGKNREELLDWTQFASEDAQILEEVPEDVNRLELIGLAIEGRLRIKKQVNPKATLILNGAASGKLRWDGSVLMVAEQKADKNVFKKLLKLGLVGEDLKPTEASADLEEITYWEYPPGKKAVQVGSGRVNKLITGGFVSVDGNYVRVTDAGLALVPKLTEALRFNAKVLLVGFKFFSTNWRWIKKYNPEFDVVPVDEIHHSTGYSTHSSQQTQQFYQAMERFNRFVPMTGTLVNGRLDSAYPTIHVLDPRYYPNHHQFMAEHAIYDQWGHPTGSWKNHGKLTQILARHGSRRSFEEVHGPEGKIIIPEFLDMNPEMRAAYDEFHQLAILELEDEFLDGSSPAVHALRARQIISCPEIFGLCKGEPLAKDERLKVHLEDRERDGLKFIVFSVFIPEQERLRALIESHGLKVEMMNANTPNKHRLAIDAAFRHGDIQSVVCSEILAGVGYNWGDVDFMHFMSYDYQDGNFLQAYRRAIRGKRERPLRLYLPQYKNSVEQRILRVVDRKSRDANEVDPTRQRLGLSQLLEDA